MGAKCSKCSSKCDLEDLKSISIADRQSFVENSIKDSIIQLAGDDSLLTLEKIIKNFPENPDLLAKFASSIYEKGLIVQAQDCLNRLLSTGYVFDLKSSLVFAHIQIQNKNYESAIETLTQSIENNRKSHEAHALLSEIYSLLSQNRKSIKHIKKALKITKKVPEYYNVYGLYLMKENNHSEALKNFLLAYDLDPTMAKALNNAGNAYRKIGNTSQAILCYIAAINLIPKRMFPIALINLATAYFYIGDILQTLNYFEEALQTGANIHKIMLKKGYYLLFKNPKTKHAIELLIKQEVLKSIQVFTEVLLTDPYNPIVNFYMALNLVKLTRAVEAHERFRVTIE